MLWCGEADHTPKKRALAGKQGSEENKANFYLLRVDSSKSCPKCGITEGIHSTKPWKREILGKASDAWFHWDEEIVS